MPDVQILTTLPWGIAAPVQALTVLPWGVAAPVQTFGEAYSFPGSPPGGEVVSPGDLRAPVALAAAAAYSQVHTLEVRDLRTDALLPVQSCSLSLDDGSVYWTLQAGGEGLLFEALTTGVQPASVQVTIDGLVWAFVVESVTRPRAFASDRVSFSGRSLASVADAPYQFEASYISDAPTSAAQLAASALQPAGVALRWELDDWLLPAGSVSLTGTPMEVVQTVAAAVGAVVTAHASELEVAVHSRYPTLPNEWAYQVPDVQVHSRAVVAETFERADRPAYTGVLVAGQTGQLAYIRLEGTSGADQAPMVTDQLLTDAVALQERGRVVLGAGGQQARVSQTLPVRVGAGEPGVLRRGWLMRCLEQPADAASVTSIWHGVVRGVQVQASLAMAQQSISVERHTAFIVDPDNSPALVLPEPIPDQDAEIGTPFELDLTPYRSGGSNPYAWLQRAGVLPAGLVLNSDQETISGIPLVPGVVADLRLRVTDRVSRMQDSEAFSIDVGYPGNLVLLLHADGTPGATTFSDSSPYARTITRAGGSVSDAQARFGQSYFNSSSTSSGLSATSSAEMALGAGDFMIDVWVYPTSLPGAAAYRGILSKRAGEGANFAFTFYLDGDTAGLPAFAYSLTGAGTTAVVRGPAISAGALSHLRVARKGSQIGVAANGVYGTLHNIGTAAIHTSTASLYVGRLSAGLTGNCFLGYIDELLFLVGGSVGLSNFAPPEAPWVTA